MREGADVLVNMDADNFAGPGCRCNSRFHQAPGRQPQTRHDQGRLSRALNWTVPTGPLKI
jgi:hypothetical protein